MYATNMLSKCRHQALAPKCSRKAVVVRARRDSIVPFKSGSRSSYPSTSPPVPVDSTSYGILEAFYYGRAFATTLNKKLSEAVVDVVAEVSKTLAERPTRIKEFQDEVAMLVKRDMADAMLPERPNGSSTPSGGSAIKPQPQDLQATVDDLRAEIAYSRAILQQIKAAKV